MMNDDAAELARLERENNALRDEVATYRAAYEGAQLRLAPAELENTRLVEANDGLREALAECSSAHASLETELRAIHAQGHKQGDGIQSRLQAILDAIRADVPAQEQVALDPRLLELYQAPFRFDPRGGYLWDAQNNQAMRVCGWGRLGYRPDGAEVQDLMGQALADALTAAWNNAQGGGA